MGTENIKGAPKFMYNLNFAPFMRKCDVQKKKPVLRQTVKAY